ncbi:MAG: excinuclease ABC subunit UvrC [Bacilli bacterium]|nr:excinuclease ABC subunit UvrC [Bacilli bacterium]
MAHALGFVYTLFLILANFRKKFSQILIFQTISFFFKGLHYLLLGGLSGFWSSNISMVRNLIFSKTKNNKFFLFLFIFVYVVFGILSYNDFCSILPLFASVFYTVIISFKKPKYLRSGMIINCLLWLIYNIYILSIAGIITQFLVIVMTFISIIKLDKRLYLNYNSGSEVRRMIQEKLNLVPHLPGCYLMKNEIGTIIYVGKAKDLKNRLNSYFHSSHTGKTAKLVSEIRDFEYIVVSSETESLILELNLIKKHDPKYNILLRDDKTYPYIELTNDKVLRLQIVRQPHLKKKNTHLFGPYPNAGAAKKTVNLLNRIYPLRKCTPYNKRTCLYYHIGQCLGYCTHNVPLEKVESMKKDIIRFLKGDHELVTKKILEEIDYESMQMHYEKALELKELLDYINITLVKQKVEIADELDRDIFGYYTDNNYLSIFVFFVRSSKIAQHHHVIIPLIDEVPEELTRYIAKFYDNKILPKEILVPKVVDDKLLESYLNVNVKKPVKGVKKKLIDMANNNAQRELSEKITLLLRNEEKISGANEELRKILHMNKLHRIELFDNAHLFGSYNVSGMVVFKDGKPSKNDYRKYKISTDKNDDYGTMREVIYRRYFRVLKDNLERPDLIIVDGGIGQIHVAKEVLDSLNMDIMLVGLKKDDKHQTNALLTIDKEIEIEKRSDLFHYLERMQDEVHNFTINYHKQIRSKGAYASILDNIPGIGEKRQKALLKKYKSVSNIKKQTSLELQSILPKEVADNLLEALKDI